MANDDNGEGDDGDDDNVDVDLDVDGKVEEERGEVQQAAEEKQAEVTVDAF